MEVEAGFPKIVVRQEVVEHADGAVPPFPNVGPLIDQVVYLFGSKN